MTTASTPATPRRATSPALRLPGTTPDLAADATAADFFQAIVDKYGYDLSDTGINLETAGTSISDFIYAELGDKAAEYQAGVTTGSTVPNIPASSRPATTA